MSGIPPAPGPKLVYLARRHPFLDHDHFVARWRGHGALAQQLQGWLGVSRYEQNEAIPVPDSLLSALPGGSTVWDGVGIVWARDDEAMNGYGTKEQQTILRHDELQTFSDVVLSTSFIGRETIAEGDRLCGVKLIGLIGRPGEDDAVYALDGFHHAVTNAAGFSDRVVKYVMSPAIDVAYPGGDGPGLQGYTAAFEIGFASVDDLVAAVSAPSFAAVVAPAWVSVAHDRAITVAVREVRLYDET